MAIAIFAQCLGRNGSDEYQKGYEQGYEDAKKEVLKFTKNMNGGLPF